MKKLLLWLLMLNSVHIVAAQKKFEGKILYKFFEGSGKNKMMIEAYFGKQKIKAVLKESSTKGNGQDDLLIDLGNGVIHYLNPANQTYRTDTINKNVLGFMPAVKAAPEKNKIVLNYHATAYSGEDTLKSDFMGAMNFTVWYADSLYFPFDKKYATAEMIPIFGNGDNIAMGFEMDMGKAVLASFHITPVSIDPMLLADSVFIIPSGYSLRTNEQLAPDSVVTTIDSLTMTAVEDSVMAVIDSAASTIKKEAKRSAPKKRSKQSSPKQPQKNSAAKPKE